MTRVLISLLLAAAQFGVAEELPDQTVCALPLAPFAPAVNPSTPAKVELGRLLFFDPILSATQDVACATCHHPQYGWADGRSTPLGVHANGLGPQRRLLKAGEFPPLQRNAPTILNVGFVGLVNGKTFAAESAPMFWDSRVQSLEFQALVPIRNREEMRGDASSDAGALRLMVGRLNQIKEYRDRFHASFDGPIDEIKVSQALAAYERSLIVTNAPFDRFMRGDVDAMSPLQQQGMTAFQKAGCARCHNGPMLSDFKLHSIGITDSGTTRSDFRTPSLRNLRHTAPYMHNGGLMTLDQVMLFYDRLMDQVSETIDGGDASSLPPLDPLLSKMNLLPEDHAAIIAFLDALSSDDYDRTTPTTVPSGLPVAGITQTSPSQPSDSRHQ